MYAQVCKWVSKHERTDWKPGIAILKFPNTHDIEYIVDAEGTKVKKGDLYNYELVSNVFIDPKAW